MAPLFFRLWEYHSYGILRYLVLRDNVIYYYKADSDLEPKGSIFLDGCRSPSHVTAPNPAVAVHRPPLRIAVSRHLSDR